MWTDASACGWRKPVSLWRRAHRRAAARRVAVSPERRAGLRAAVDGRDRRGDSRQELPAVWGCVEQQWQRGQQLRLHGGVDGCQRAGVSAGAVLQSVGWDASSRGMCGRGTTNDRYH